MIIDLANIVDRNFPLRTLKMAFQSVCSEACPQTPTPSGSRLRLSRHLTLLKNYPDFTYLKGWTVWVLILCVRQMGHFQVDSSLCFETSLSAKVLM